MVSRLNSQVARGYARQAPTLDRLMACQRWFSKLPFHVAFRHTLLRAAAGVRAHASQRVR